jgi:Capsular polysaccharide biosynthesis protein
MNGVSDLREQAYWDDEIDLRQLVETLLRHKWVIVGLVVAATAVAGIYSYFILPPRYEAVMTVALPAADGADGIGMSVAAYDAFAGSNRVLSAVLARSGLDLTPRQLSDRLQRSVNANERLLTVTASAQTAGEAHRLTLMWRDAFEAEVRAYVREQLDEALDAALRELERAREALSRAEAALVAFDRETPLGLLSARLARLETELAAAETELQRLQNVTIPLESVRVQLLEDMLAAEPGLASTSAYVDGLTRPLAHDPAGVAAPLHPAAELASARARLETNQQAAELLQRRIEDLHERIAALNHEQTLLEKSGSGCRTRWIRQRRGCAAPAAGWPSWKPGPSSWST